MFQWSNPNKAIQTSTIIEWNKLDQDIRNGKSYALFRKHLLSFIGLKLLTSLRVGFSHLKEHKFRHNFVNPINPLCSCENFVESTTHFFLHCTHFSNQSWLSLTKSKILTNVSLIKMTPS